MGAAICTDMSPAKGQAPVRARLPRQRRISNEHPELNDVFLADTGAADRRRKRRQTHPSNEAARLNPLTGPPPPMSAEDLATRQQQQQQDANDAKVEDREQDEEEEYRESSNDSAEPNPDEGTPSSHHSHNTPTSTHNGGHQAQRVAESTPAQRFRGASPASTAKSAHSKQRTPSNNMVTPTRGTAHQVSPNSSSSGGHVVRFAISECKKYAQEFDLPLDAVKMVVRGCGGDRALIAEVLAHRTPTSARKQAGTPPAQSTQDANEESGNSSAGGKAASSPVLPTPSKDFHLRLEPTTPPIQNSNSKSNKDCNVFPYDQTSPPSSAGGTSTSVAHQHSGSLPSSMNGHHSQQQEMMDRAKSEERSPQQQQPEDHLIAANGSSPKKRSSSVSLVEEQVVTVAEEEVDIPFMKSIGGWYEKGQAWLHKAIVYTDDDTTANLDMVLGHLLRLPEVRGKKWSRSIPNDFLSGSEEVVRFVSKVPYSGQLQQTVEEVMWDSIGDGFCSDCVALEDCSNLSQILSAPSTTVGLMRVRSIGSHFFDGCVRLVRIDIAPLNGIQTVPDSFLAGCSSLVYVDLSPLHAVTYIGNLFLEGCTSLRSEKEEDATPVIQQHSSSLHSSGRRRSSATNSALEGVPDASLAPSFFAPLSQVQHIGTHFMANCTSFDAFDLSGLQAVQHVGKKFLHGRSSNAAVMMGRASVAIRDRLWKRKD